MKVLAIIPARSGSKRLPSKNIKNLAGKPLIAYTIEAAKKSGSIGKIIVSTDSPKIRKISLEYGAEVPFLRPASISKSSSTEMEFIEHALSWLEEREKYIPDLIVILYPTAPFRKSASIKAAVNFMKFNYQFDSLRSVRLCEEHPYKMWIVQGEDLRPFIRNVNSNMHTMSYQSLPKVYIQNANIYIARYNTIKKYGSPIGKKVAPFIMDDIESVDINNYLDFKIAEILIKEKYV